MLFPSDPLKRFWFCLGVVTVIVLLYLSDEVFNPSQYSLYVRARDALKNGDAASAEDIYRKLVTKYPDDIDGYRALGGCLYCEKKYEEAKTVYQRASKLNPQSSIVYYDVGCIAYEQGRMEEARTNLEKALLYDDKDGLSHRLLAFVYEQSGDLSLAISHYERAIALDPSIANDPAITHRLELLKSAVSSSPPPAATNGSPLQ